ncbi:lisH domain-containing protein ARMC9-like isoform X2 [Lineus longissimus]|uniref:lisH domain-containing protein ARMC9-like isoform X2 n=1 Tax=Lineus longissimus TaxID=88925 RepID=UPI00315DA4D7
MACTCVQFIPPFSRKIYQGCVCRYLVRDNSKLLIGRELTHSQPSTPGRRRMSSKVSTVAFEGELNAIVREYLEHGEYAKTQEIFEQECSDRGRHISQSSDKPKSNQKLLAAQNEMIKYFQLGNGHKFFKLWDSFLPPDIKNDDPVAQKLEFYLNIYFATFPMREGKDKDEVEDAMTKFKTYIETRGAALSQTTEFLPFYALPFVPNPRAHPTYRELFSDTWVSDLQLRIEKFLTLAMASSAQPRLFELYNSGGGGKDLQGQISIMQQQIVDAEKRTMTYMKRHNKVQADYHNLIGITAELVDALESTVQGKPVTPEYLQQICGRLFQSQTRFASQSLDLTRPGTAAEVLRNSIAPKNEEPPPRTPVPVRQTTPDILSIYDVGNDGSSFTSESDYFGSRMSVNSQVPSLPPLDFEKVKKDLQDGSERNKIVLLQALRWRLTRSLPGEQRDSVISSYINNDLLGCAQPGAYRTTILELLTSPSEVVRQYIARLFNAFASLCPGRTYLSLNSDLLRGLMSNLRSEDKDSITRENVLGALQKLSLRRNLQSAMIEEGIINWLVDVLEDNDSLSDYTLEYSVALLMNLCLRTAGKKKCATNAHKTLKVLSDLLGHENAEILPYVNGTLYSILAIQSIRDEAKAMGMEEILKCFIKDGQPDMNRQIEFIIKQLNSSEESDDAESDDDDDEEEDEEDQDAMEADLDKAELIAALPGETTGEELLRTQYAGVPQSSHKKRRDQLLANEPLTRPVTPGQRRAGEFSLAPSRSQSRNSQQRPKSRDVERPPTRSGSRPGTAESNRSGGSGEKQFSSGTPRPSQKSLEKQGSQADVQEYGKAFSSRPKIPRTPDVTGGRPTSRGSVADAAPQPTYSDTLPRSRPGSGSSRNGHAQNSNSSISKKKSSSTNVNRRNSKTTPR